MFRLKVRNLNDLYSSTNEELVADFLQAIGFLGTDGAKARQTKRTKTGILLFTKC